jgi:predicted O-methyltransferase YrrM
MTAKLRVTFWFLRHPRLYPEFYRWVKRKTGSLGVDRKKEKAETVRWCEERSVDAKTAILKITGLADFEPFEEKFKKQLKVSKEILDECPVKMAGPGNLELIYQLAEYVQATRVIETGVAAGWSSLVFLLSLKSRSGLLVSTNMPYPGAPKVAEKYVGCVVPRELRRMWKIIERPDREGLPKALKTLPTIDMCHYDSDKSYDGRLWAYPRLWNALRSGGIFISDDVDDNFGFRDFCDSVGEEPVIVKTPASLGFKYVGILVKSGKRTE